MGIRKIKTIKNMAVFRNFDWDTSVCDKANKPIVFSKINILYGRNYSGKTTISRIIRGLETGIISDKYNGYEFVVEIRDNPVVVDQKTPRSHTQTIRVFNEDFVRDNLRFISNETEGITSFAILGDDNNNIEKKIEEIGLGLGSEESENGLLGGLKKANNAYSRSKKDHEKARDDLEEKLRSKANDAPSGIKHNNLCGDPNYNITKIKSDVQRVLATDYKPIDASYTETLRSLLKEEPKPPIPELHQAHSQILSSVMEQVKGLIEKRINVSEPIQELLDDAVLQTWVRDGRNLHKDKRTKCGFCGNVLPADLWEKLDKHFNQESEILRRELKSISEDVYREIEITNNLASFDANQFYSSYSTPLKDLNDKYRETQKAYVESLKQLNAAIRSKLDDIFTPKEMSKIKDVTQDFEYIFKKYEEIRVKSNETTTTLSARQQKAKTDLRLAEVYSFVKDIKYEDECKKIKGLEDVAKESYKDLDTIQSEVDAKRSDIAVLRARLKDESKGADRVNYLLNNFFGHDSLSLKTVEGEAGCRFEVTRDGSKAYHLSEGECSLIALCYFMAKLEDVETKGNNPIIWIDDPISSLDANHIFFAFSLINSEIVKKANFKQLFVSTHNLDFLKYLKKIAQEDDVDANGKTFQKEFFILDRKGPSSYIKRMPDYLKDYVTEFNYLFHQIYKCAHADNTKDSDHEWFYNYGNNARKFLEAFLYFKYPNANKKDSGKLKRFFGEDAQSSVLTNRMHNEYSHLAGVFERSMVPIDIPEMKKTALFILKKIQEKDPDQYDALLESIGEKA